MNKARKSITLTMRTFILKVDASGEGENALRENVLMRVREAVKVVEAMKSMGSRVTHTYLTLPILMTNVVPMQRASIPSNWLAVPKRGQIVEMEPVKMKYPQARTTMKLAAIFPVMELKFPNGLYT